jgi:hypothetical protein
MGNHVRLFEPKGGGTELAVVVLEVPLLAVVVTETVTVSGGLTLELELATYGFRGSLVLMAQLALGALVLQEK